MKEFEIALKIGKELTDDMLRSEAARKLGVQLSGVGTVRVVKRSIDARQDVLYRYRVEAYRAGETAPEYALPPYQDVHDAEPVIVVGAGPAGMFAALRLLMEGFRPVILERGKDVHARKRDMATLSTTGAVNPESNYCFGEGGAGAFSDGKLYTRSSKRGDIREVLHQLVAFGADPSILIDAHPHIGTDRLPIIVEKIRECIIEHGGEYHFDTKVVDILPSSAEEAVGSGGLRSRCSLRPLPLSSSSSLRDNSLPAGPSPYPCPGVDTPPDPTASSAPEGRLSVITQTPEGEKSFRAAAVILATGHSARDIYELIHAKGWALEAKGFALGVRVEHPQWLINQIRYHGKYQPFMPTAEYSFVHQEDGRGVFSFCMCPGGVLVPSATEEQSIVLNGMSNSARNSKWANAGVVVQIEPGDEPEEYRSRGPFALMDFQRDVERSMFAYTAEHRREGQNPLAAPAQRMKDFCRGLESKDLPKTSYTPGAIPAPLHELLPEHVARRLRRTFPQIDRQMHGYYTNDALLLGVESRTSSPVRIPRDPETLQHPACPGLYPCGEGAGYAGGIVSSALDGIACAMAACQRWGSRMGSEPSVSGRLPADGLESIDNE